MTRTTPGQTVGPFFGMALPYDGGAELVPAGSPGAVRLHGRVTDGAGAPVIDALVELWQSDPHGDVPRQEGSLHRDGWSFTGWGRAGTDRTGEYVFTTVVPARRRGAPFFALTVFSRGLQHRLHTRAYLPGDDALLAVDPLLAGLDPLRRQTLLARSEPHGFAFDIRLQGSAETVFLAHRPVDTTR